MLEAILLPAAIITGVGVTAGFLLALAAKFMVIPVSQKLARVREALPGFNCGACGYPGCDQYAKAIAEEDAPITKCRPGRDATLQKLKEATGEE